MGRLFQVRAVRAVRSEAPICRAREKWGRSNAQVAQPCHLPALIAPRGYPTGVFSVCYWHTLFGAGWIGTSVETVTGEREVDVSGSGFYSMTVWLLASRNSSQVPGTPFNL